MSLQRQAKLLNKRRVREVKQVTNVDSRKLEKGATWYIISEHWLKKWRSFVNNEGKRRTSAHSQMLIDLLLQAL